MLFIPDALECEKYFNWSWVNYVSLNIFENDTLRLETLWCVFISKTAACLFGTI